MIEDVPDETFSAGTLLGLLGLITYPQLVSNRRYKCNSRRFNSFTNQVGGGSGLVEEPTREELQQEDDQYQGVNHHLVLHHKHQHEDHDQMNGQCVHQLHQ